MRPYLSPLALILVAIIPSPEDFQLARLLGWYRIPLRSAPRILHVDFLAFYQPAAFQAARWQVEYIAPVLGHELTTRRELLQDQAEHPRAEDDYFRISLGPFWKLERPIAAGDWKRFTFLYTTGEYLRNARTLSDLTVRSSERRALWRTLRERADRLSAYRDAPCEIPEDLPLDLLSALLGIPVESAQ